MELLNLKEKYKLDKLESMDQTEIDHMTQLGLVLMFQFQEVVIRMILVVGLFLTKRKLLEVFTLVTT